MYLDQGFVEPRAYVVLEDIEEDICKNIQFYAFYETHGQVNTARALESEGTESFGSVRSMTHPPPGALCVGEEKKSLLFLLSLLFLSW